MSTREIATPLVVHIYGFEPLTELHAALARVKDLREYEFITPNHVSYAQILTSAWTYNALSYFDLPDDWHTRPLYLIQPHSIHMGLRVWRRVIEQFVAAHPGSLYQLQIESGIKQHRPERWIVQEMVLYGGQKNRYL